MEWTSIIDCAYDADIDVGDESDNIITCTIQLKDFEGKDLAVLSCIYAYFSDSSTGDDIVSTSFSDTLDTDDGEYILGGNEGIDMHLISESDGDIAFKIKEQSLTHASYLVLVMPNGKLVVSDAITFA